MDALADLDRWHLAALGAILLGFGNLALAKAGKQIPPFRALLTVMSGYLAWQFSSELSISGRRDEVVALIFGGASAPIGWFLFAQNGAILLFGIRALLMLLVSLIAFLTISPKIPGLSALIASFVIGSLVFVPFRKCARQVRAWIWSGRSDRTSSSSTVEKETVRRLESSLEKAQCEVKASTSRLDRLEKRAQKAHRREMSQEAQLERRRSETTSHVRALLALQEEQDQDIPQYETTHGFLMLETSRVLRSQIDAGERTPPLELLPFYFEVLAELLQDDDFESRYFHPASRQIVRAVNAFHRGECPLRSVHDLVHDLDHSQYAPRPFLGDIEEALVEGWFLPFRRHQERQFELYQSGEHPRQSELSERTLGVPEQVTIWDWRAAWDEEPWLFVAEPPHGGNEEESDWWTRISRFWSP